MLVTARAQTPNTARGKESGHETTSYIWYVMMAPSLSWPGVTMSHEPFISSLMQSMSATVLRQEWAWFSTKSGRGPKISHALCARFYLVYPHTRTSSYATNTE